MWRITIAGLIAHRVRYALTAVAVLLGVSFMAGTLVLTDTIGRTFDGLFTDVYRGTSAVVRGSEPFDAGANFTSQRPAIPASLVDNVRAVAGVSEVRVGIDGYAQLVGRNGKPIGNPGSGAPTLGQAWNDVRKMNPYRLLPGGYPPRSASEVAIDKHSADVGHLRVGDHVVVLTKRAPATYTITGIVRWGSADSPLGASITLFDPGTAARMLGEPGKVNEIDVAAGSGISQQEMVRRLREALPQRSLDIVTGAQITNEGQDAVRKALGFFNTFLLVFAGIALFVGSFLIFNTFSIVVAQRMRELALLRAVGAGRGQVVGSVLGESLAIGVVASAAGLGAGIGLAVGLRAMLNAFGIDIPSTGLLVSARTVIVCLMLGTIVTVVSAISPARKAGKVAPIAALREVVIDEETRRTLRTVSGAAVTAAGIAMLTVGLFTHVADRVTLVGLGGAATFVGVAVLGPLISRPLSRFIGAPLRWRGTTGLLARNNAMRNPKRTASTAAALTIGVALVTLMSVLAASLKASVGAAVDKAMRADFVVSSGSAQPGTATGFSPALQRQLAGLPQVASATGVRVGTARIAGATRMVFAADPRHVQDLFDLGLRSGDVEAMTPTGIAVSTYVADSKHLGIGDPVHVQFTATGTRTFTVQAIYSAREVAGDYVLPLAAAQRNFSMQLDFQVYVKLAAGVSAQQGRDAIGHVLAGYPTAKLLDRTEYKAQQLNQIDQLLNLVYGLLALALLIALIGIANTLGLSIRERTRELGLLRAVGMTRGQLRATVRGEALITALLGVAQGLVVGTGLGWAVVRALGSQGVSHLSIPLGQLGAVAVLAAVAAVVAAAAPGRRAARLDILRAIATD
jgi:putative ABC transport system permease protein